MGGETTAIDLATVAALTTALVALVSVGVTLYKLRSERRQWQLEKRITVDSAFLGRLV